MPDKGHCRKMLVLKIQDRAERTEKAFAEWRNLKCRKDADMPVSLGESIRVVTDARVSKKNDTWTRGSE